MVPLSRKLIWPHLPPSEPPDAPKKKEVAVSIWKRTTSRRAHGECASDSDLIYCREFMFCTNSFHPLRVL